MAGGLHVESDRPDISLILLQSRCATGAHSASLSFSFLMQVMNESYASGGLGCLRSSTSLRGSSVINLSFAMWSRGSRISMDLSPLKNY